MTSSARRWPNAPWRPLSPLRCPPPPYRARVLEKKDGCAIFRGFMANPLPPPPPAASVAQGHTRWERTTGTAWWRLPWTAGLGPPASRRFNTTTLHPEGEVSPRSPGRARGFRPGPFLTTPRQDPASSGHKKRTSGCWPTPPPRTLPIDPLSDGD